MDLLTLTLGSLELPLLTGSLPLIHKGQTQAMSQAPVKLGLDHCMPQSSLAMRLLRLVLLYQKETAPILPSPQVTVRLCRPD